MPDDMSPIANPAAEEFVAMRWAYGDDSRAKRHACERIWAVELSHVWKDRGVFKKALKDDLQQLESHQARRRRYIARKKQGSAGLANRKAAGIRKTQVKQRTRNEVNLIPPEDFF